MASFSFPFVHHCACRHGGDLLLFLVSFLLLSVPYASHGQNTVPAMYVFGDSLADVGNNNYLPLSLLKANFPHNGVDYPGSKATGRFSNGKNAVDFLAEKLGLQSPPPYLSLILASNRAEAFQKGVSFASGGSGVLNTTNKDQCLTLDDQISFFSNVYTNLLQKLGGAAATQKHLSQSIFALVIGSNDLLGYYKTDPSQRPKPPQQFVDSLVSTLRGQLTRLYDLGARKVVFVGTGPVGCSPAMRVRNATGACSEETNHGSTLFKQGALSLLRAMKSELGDMSYSFFDAYAALSEYIRNPTAYGFAEVRSACCGLGTLRAKLPCLPVAAYCGNRKDHIFWDFYHPTEAASRLLVDAYFDGSQPYVYPINVRQLAGL